MAEGGDTVAGAHSARSKAEPVFAPPACGFSSIRSAAWSRCRLCFVHYDTWTRLERAKERAYRNTEDLGFEGEEESTK